MRKLLVTALLLVMVVLPASGETLSSMNDLVSYALAHSYSYTRALYDANTAYSSLATDAWYESSSMSLRSDAAVNSTTNGVSATLSVDVPVNDYLTISGNIDTALSGKMSVSINPLAQPESTVEEELAYENASLNLAELKQSISNDVVSAYISYRLAEEELSLTEKQADLAKQEYEFEQELYDLGEVTLIELQEVLDDLSDAQNSVSTGRNSLTTAKRALMQTLGAETAAELTLPVIDLQAFADLATVNEDTDYAASTSVMGTYAVISAVNSEKTAQDTYDTQRLFEPNVSISSNISTSGAITGSVSFSMGFDSFKEDVKADYLDALTLAQQNTLSTISSAQYSLDALIESIAYDKLQIADARRQVEMTQRLIDEAETLYAHDEYDELDLASLKLSAESKELSLMKEILDWYEHQLEIKVYLTT